MGRSPFKLLEILLTKHLWIFNTVTLTAVAYFLANGAGELITARILESLPEVEVSPPPRYGRRPEARRAARPPSGRAILDRNIFDSTLGPIDRDASNGVPEEAIDGDPKALVPCDDQDLKLLATVVSDTDDQWSFASLAEGEETHLHRAGEQIGDRTVAEITWQYVLFEEGGGYCYLDMFSEANLDKLKAKRGKKKRRSRNNSRLKKGIKVIGKNKRLVKRRIVKEVMSNPAQFAKNVRFRPRKRNGRVVGYQVRRMKRDGPLALIGFKRRDVIKEINGIPLTNMDKVFKAYQGLGSADEIRFAINRRGRPMELEVRVQ